jgi:hypothetical protein
LPSVARKVRGSLYFAQQATFLLGADRLMLQPS